VSGPEGEQRGREVRLSNRAGWAAIWALVCVSCLQPAAAQTPELYDPRDGGTYGTVSIGDRLWFAENLDFQAASGTRCFEDRPEYCGEYGRLYTWAAAVVACPSGWRLPTEGDWQDLERSLGMGEGALGLREYRGSDEGAKLRVGGASGFDANQSGYMRPDGTPRRRGERSAFWTATEAEAGATAWHRDVSEDPRIYRSPVSHDYFLSVRCVRDGDSR
jgi:uncharacterized protein (TIGR02145 family)